MEPNDPKTKRNLHFPAVILSCLFISTLLFAGYDQIHADYQLFYAISGTICTACLTFYALYGARYFEDDHL